MLEELITRERSLWTNNADVYEQTLVEDAVLVFAETGVIGRDTAVAAIREENREGRHWASVTFDGVRLSRPADGVALLTYRADARWAHETTIVSVMASSLYVERADGWKLAFHQQTALPAP